MLTNEELERFCQHYHRHSDQLAAAKHARAHINDREAYDLATRILRSVPGQRRLIEMKNQASEIEPLEEYIAKLKDIRDRALDAQKFAPAINAHLLLGKLAGHFDRPEADPGAVGDAATLTNEELLARIQRLTSNPTKVIELRPETIRDAE